MFVLILGACTLALPGIPFISRSGLGKARIRLLFLIKVAAGMLIGWIYARNTSNGGDYWTLHRYGLEEYRLLLKDPMTFFTGWLQSPYEQGWGGFFASTGSHWNDLRHTLIEKFLGILNLFTAGNYYTNTVVFDFIGFWGAVALFRTWMKIYPRDGKSLLIGCFLLPSPLFFLSGLHKDLFIFTALCFLLYLLYQIINEKYTHRRLMMLVFCFLLLLLFRNYVAIALLPGAIAFMLTVKRKAGKPAAFGIIYGLALLLIITVHYLFPGKGPLHILVSKHEDFKALNNAHSRLTMFDLTEDPVSFIRNLPAAANHAFSRPFPAEAVNPYHLAFATELVCFWILALVAIIRERKKKMPSFSLFMICFAVTGLLFIGFIVPNAGSIIRYRSFYYPFLLVPVFVGLLRKRTNTY